MSTTELAALVNQSCLVTVGKMKVRCLINDAARQFGNNRILVQPVVGSGETWLNVETVKLLGKEGK